MKSVALFLEIKNIHKTQNENPDMSLNKSNQTLKIPEFITISVHSQYRIL